MKIIYKQLSKNNITESQLNSMQNLDELMFENHTYKSLGYNIPSCAILAYSKTDSRTDLVGKINVNVKTNNYNNLKISRAQISNLAVLPFYQNNGIGGNLLKKSLLICRMNNLDYAYLNIDLTSRLSKKLIRFYSKNGFIPSKSSSLQSNKHLTMLYPIKHAENLSEYEADLVKSFYSNQKK